MRFATIATVVALFVTYAAAASFHARTPQTCYPDTCVCNEDGCSAGPACCANGSCPC
ncbi:hypothetical protein B0H17DRAFT_1199844 [Mycena rosella]|uniref:Uncharacterized protein n=1 Tax=Mycena rosella TaxID=1033263 RepID=A0AAD7DJM4_MYCRO|nr:hypothetical protein B0H17DRAFT_1199844 [Mycena rosella]